MKIKSIFIFLVFITASSYSQNYFQITGKIIDKKTKEPLSFSSVYVSGEKYVGSISNELGDFIIKIPKELSVDSLHVSFVSYKPNSFSIQDINDDTIFNLIELEGKSILLNEYIVTAVEPLELLDQAFKKIPENYDVKPIMMRGFYSENMKLKIKLVGDNILEKNNIESSLGHKEAILDIYRNPFNEKYTKKADNDYIKLIAWRQTGDKSDSSILGDTPFSGAGPNTLINNDPLKDIKSLFLFRKNRKNYDFKLKGVKTIDLRDVYVIEFDQKNSVKKQLYKGSILIDKKSLAFNAIEYHLSAKGKKYNSMDKILFFGTQLHDFSKIITYKKYNQKWNLLHINYSENRDIEMYNTTLIGKTIFKKHKIKADSIKINFKNQKHIIITEVEKTNVTPFEKNELFTKSSEVKSESNKDVWGDYNYFNSVKKID